MGVDDVRRAQGARLRLARERLNLGDATAGAAFLTKTLNKKVSRETYIQHENGTRGMTRAVADYAKGYLVSEEWLLWGRNEPDWLPSDDRAQTSAPPPPPLDLESLRAFITQHSIPKPPPIPLQRMREIGRVLPVMGEVAAGQWREASARELHQAEEWIPLDVAGYERAQLYLLRVVGDSMDLYYPPGRYVIVAPAHEAGMNVGDHVVVERNRSGLVELTVKELVNESGRAVLAPRSSNPDWKPINLYGQEGDQDAPRIVGIVVGDYGKRQRPLAAMFSPPRESKPK